MSRVYVCFIVLHYYRAVNSSVAIKSSILYQCVTVVVASVVDSVVVATADSGDESCAELVLLADFSRYFFEYSFVISVSRTSIAHNPVTRRRDA